MDQEHDSERRRRGFWRFLAKWTLVAAIWGVAGLGILLAVYASDLPDVHQIGALKKRPGITILADDGSLLAHSGDLYGSTLTVDQLPPDLVHAFVAIEDRRFYHHFGIDPIGLARALFVHWRTGNRVQATSTLTQQLARNLFLSADRNFKRKVQEALLALQMEYVYSKDQILTGYVNRVYLGAGAYGVDAAAQTYFGKPATELNLQECAIIAGLVKAPSRYSPASDIDAAVDRSQLVLRAMRREGYITDAQLLTALSSPPPEIRRPMMTDGARYVADWIIAQTRAHIGDIDQDITIQSTIDPAAQQAAEQKIEDALTGPAAKVNASQAALVAMTPAGAVRAMVGGRDYDDSQFNRATQALRQPGSAFKPFVYLAALQNGLRPDSLVEDAPIKIGRWAPSNFEPGYRGRIPAREALADSINTAAIRVLDFAGIDRTRNLAAQLGISEKIPRDLSIALGTSDTTLLELTGAYAAFANGGSGVIPYAVEKVTDIRGKPLYERKGAGPGEVALPWHVAELDSMLVGVIDHGTGKAARLDRPAAGKTGTSQDYRNAWFMGFTADLVTGVWFGNDDNSPMKRVTGGSLPAQTWRAFMLVAEAKHPARDLLPLARAPAAAVALETADQTAQAPAPADEPSAPAPSDEGGMIGRLLKSLTGG